MKTYLIILLLFVGINVHSQGFRFSPEYYPVEVESVTKWTPVSYSAPSYSYGMTWWQRNRRPLAIIGWHVGTVALGSIADGLYDNGNKTWSHALHAAEVGALITGPLIHRITWREAGWYVLDYAAFRLALFDLGYNITRGLDPLSVGSTSLYGKMMSEVPEHGRAFVKSWALIGGFAIPFGEMKGARKKVKNKNCK